MVNVNYVSENTEINMPLPALNQIEMDAFECGKFTIQILGKGGHSELHPVLHPAHQTAVYNIIRLNWNAVFIYSFIVCW